MSELRLYLRRDSLRDNDDCAWILRQADGRIAASGSSLERLPKADRCHLVLASDLVSIFPARLPDWPLRKLSPLLPGAAEAHAFGEAEQLHVAWLGRDDQGLSWLAVTDRAWLHFTLERLTAQGLRVDAVLPEFLLLPLEADAWSLVRHEDGTLLRASPIFGLALDQGDPPAGLQLALESEAALQAARPRRLCVYQGTALQAADLMLWQEICKLPNEPRGTWSWRDSAWPAPINLLQGALLPRHDRFDLGFLLRPLAWGGLALAVIQMAGLALDTLMLSREQQKLQAGMRQMAERVLPVNAAIADPAWQVAALLKTMQFSSGNDPEGMVTVLGQVGKLQPPDGDYELQAAAYEAGRLTLEYAKADKAWLDKFVAALAAGGLSAAVAPGQGGGVSLTVTASAAAAGSGGARGR